MHSPESTTHYYCEWHTKYGGGMSVCCECYPEECVKNREAKEEGFEEDKSYNHTREDSALYPCEKCK